MQANLAFLTKVREEGLLLRRVNIRQVAGLRREFRPGVDPFRVHPIQGDGAGPDRQSHAAQLLPSGTKLTRVLTELSGGTNRTFGRQIGTYPLLVGFNYPIELGRYLDAKVVDWGQRSVTAVEYPLKVNCAPLAAPRVAAIHRARSGRCGSCGDDRSSISIRWEMAARDSPAVPATDPKGFVSIER